MNIYVADELRQRMNRIDDQVNWSEVAQKAFERELLVFPKKKDTNVKSVMERLGASKEAQVDAVIANGFELGRKWGEATAEYLQLKSLSESGIEDAEPDNDLYVKLSHATTPGGGETIIPAAFSESVGLSNGGSEYYPNPFRVLGFVRGALTVWKDVASKL